MLTQLGAAETLGPAESGVSESRVRSFRPFRTTVRARLTPSTATPWDANFRTYGKAAFGFNGARFDQSVSRANLRATPQ